LKELSTYFHSINFKSLNVSQFGTVEGTRLKNMSRSPSMSSWPHNIPSKSTNQFKGY